jgi:hypothetical protein
MQSLISRPIISSPLARGNRNERKNAQPSSQSFIIFEFLLLILLFAEEEFSSATFPLANSFHSSVTNST